MNYKILGALFRSRTYIIYSKIILALQTGAMVQRQVQWTVTQEAWVQITGKAEFFFSFFTFSHIFGAKRMSFKHFCIICERILGCLKVLNIFLKLQKLQNVCKAWKHICITCTRLLGLFLFFLCFFFVVFFVFFCFCFCFCFFVGFCSFYFWWEKSQ